MVVGGQASLSQRVGLLLREHAERATRVHVEAADGTHHCQHLVERVALRDVSPRCAHAETGRALGLGLGRCRRDIVQREQVRARNARLVVRRLGAIGAVLGAATGFDAQQHAALDLGRQMVRAMHRLGAERESGSGRV